MAVRNILHRKFEIYDKLNKRKITRSRDYYINGEGQIFKDCDPTGVDMSGKRRIVGVDPERFEITIIQQKDSQ